MDLTQWLSTTQLLRLSSLFQVPLLGILRPKVIELNSEVARVRLPLNPLSKNHVGSMYFGALAMGAELSIALRVVERMAREKVPINFIFKDFQCNFLLRAESDVDFICEEVKGVDALIERALREGERVDATFAGRALDKNGVEVINYRLTMSIKSTKGGRGPKKAGAEKEKSRPPK